LRTTYSSDLEDTPAAAPVRALIDYRPALRSRTGVGEYAHELAAALLARAAADPSRRLRLSLFSSSWKDRLRTAPELCGATPIDRRVPVTVLNFLWHRLEWPTVEMLANRRFDVVHSPHPLLIPSRRAAQVVTIHDLDFLTHPERTRGEIRRDYPALVREHALRAHAIVVSSHFTADQVERQLGIPRERIAICSPGAPDWRPRPRAPRDGYLLFFGTLEPRKNLGVLLDAYERLLQDAAPPPPLLIAGRPAEGSAQWLARIAAPPLAGRVTYTGYVAPDDRQALYAGATLLVMPSFNEGFGLPVLEAMTAGVPVVASRAGSLPEVLGGAGILVDPHDAADVAAGLRRVYAVPECAAECVTRGLARAGSYRWSETAKRIHDIYRVAVARRARSR
jgi:glycosyltransferase involved in cell wall biosynthesis